MPDVNEEPRARMFPTLSDVQIARIEKRRRFGRDLVGTGATDAQPPVGRYGDGPLMRTGRHCPKFIWPPRLAAVRVADGFNEGGDAQ
jgi:hypothetical protein